MSIRIVFSGIGGVGGYYGGLLAAYGEKTQETEVCFIARGANLEAIREKGVEIKTPEATIHAIPQHITDKPEEIGTADYVFCSVKSYDLDHAISQLRPVIGPHTVVIPLLNGIDITERIRKLLPGTEVWYGCVYIYARRTAPGVITTTSNRERMWFGDPQSAPERQQQLEKILINAGIHALNAKDIHYRVWKKFFLISIIASLTTYYNEDVHTIVRKRKEDFRQMGKELLAIAHAKGVNLPDSLTDETLASQSEVPAGTVTSMLADYRNGQHLESETLTGTVVRMGEALHIPTPMYSKIYDKLK